MIKLFIWLALVLVLLVSPFVGAIDFIHLNPTILYELRLPRVVFTFFAGTILALSGLLFQTLFRNALMTPYTLGISSGAVLGAGIAIKLGLASLFFGIAAISVFGFIGAIGTLLLLLFLAKFLHSSQHQSLLLLGIALSLFYSSALMVLFYMGSAIQNDTIIRFTMGSLSVIGWVYPIIIMTIALGLFGVIYGHRFSLQILSISEEQAQLKGINTKRVTFILLGVSSFAIGVLVSIAGPIGFIGLVVPHIVAKLYPVSVANRITQTALFGGLFLLACDTLARSLQTQSELPIGIVTAIIGAPFFIYLIITTKRN